MNSISSDTLRLLWESCSKNVYKQNDCMLWKGKCTNEFPSIYISQKVVLIKQISYGVSKNEWPIKIDEGKRLRVCHTCDNNLCINPQHIYSTLDEFLKISRETKIMDKFTSKSVLTDECRIWLGYVQKQKPLLHLCGKKQDVRKMIWSIGNGVEMKDLQDKFLLPTCANLKCISLQHIKIRSTQSRNKITLPQKTIKQSLANMDDDEKDNIWKRLLKKAIMNDGCLEWTGITNDAGYGLTSANGKTTSVHKLSYMLHKGDVPKNIQIRHSCDNAVCFLPNHLSLGTAYENSEDKRKSSTNMGSKNYKTSIDEETAIKIAESYKTLDSPDYKNRTERGKIFGVSVNVICSIDRGVTWSHATGNKRQDTHILERTRNKRQEGLTMEEVLILGEKWAKNTKEDLQTGCRIYSGFIDNQGYGIGQYMNISFRAHDIIYQSYRKEKRSDGQVTRHSCNNRACCNVDHLSWGTQKDNVMDTLKSGRLSWAKLNEDQVKQIKLLLILGKRTKDIAQHFDVTTSIVNNIKNETTWLHVILDHSDTLNKENLSI